MTVLSDEAILSAIDLGELEIEPFNADNLTPNGYDLTIDEIEIPQKNQGIQRIPEYSCRSQICDLHEGKDFMWCKSMCPIMVKDQLGQKRNSM